jgi:hypothetical protein
LQRESLRQAAWHIAGDALDKVKLPKSKPGLSVLSSMPGGSSRASPCDSFMALQVPSVEFEPLHHQYRSHPS